MPEHKPEHKPSQNAGKGDQGGLRDTLGRPQALRGSGLGRLGRLFAARKPYMREALYCRSASIFPLMGLSKGIPSLPSLPKEPVEPFCEIQGLPKVSLRSPSAAEIAFVLRLEPLGKERGRENHRTPERTVAFEREVKAAALRAIAGSDRPQWPWQCVELEVRAVKPRPSKRPRKVPSWAWHDGLVDAPVKPDASNVAKVVEDGLNGIAYADDAQVTRLVVESYYAERGGAPRVEVVVRLKTQRAVASSPTQESST